MDATTSAEIGPLQATPKQAERLARLRRFNLLFVYLPIAILSLLLLGLVGWLIWRAVVIGVDQTRTTTGAVADIIVMLTLCPLMLLCATGPAAAIALIVRSRQQADPAQPRTRPEGVGWLQAQLWRLDNIITVAAEKIAAVVDRVAAPIIALRARFAFVETWLESLWARLQRPWGR